MKCLKIALLGLGVASLSACSQLHHVQLSDIDQTQGELTPVSIKVNEIGFDASETARIASDMASSEKDSENLQLVATVLALMNMGPSTGNPVYNDHYADQVMRQIDTQCPSHNLTGLTSVRESTSFGTVSGEVVRVDGYCIN
ncbi:hypothetical protein [Vibrio superstes]|uniref:Lipoprotein n=1 Tax=Vibrio superstes NBRC 103154 TaxID=1219062 RepID=A0A511QX70_9VIBR|nr:hypothetical protein [Vibrio superstes]GEM81336.1 hypothetical protein VSU01S_35810 [Vibrio superstes NBRC 103154]